ncbi:hypothetical protein [Arcanobacterium buesumense]|uniref:Uncharacterized protein n=1 Tax=Arcanobacterium buesumense TaxID=2722751 RepID=A0A6H2ELQ7_9ACTO|nr:hypothetical protein [Arcanobacterium buesumense]QJC22006.1 hypothetical protein HC352_05485 [Arcanobacterium buesumense]
MAAKTKKTQNTEAVQKVTVRGIEVEIDAGVFDDFELMEDFYEIQTSNPLRVIPLFTRIFGADQKKVVLDALRGDNGRVSGTDATTFLLEVMGAISPNS